MYRWVWIVTTLTRLRLNPTSRECRTDMRQVQSMHRRVTSMFPDVAAGPNSRVLWRDETAGKPVLLVERRRWVAGC